MKVMHDITESIGTLYHPKAALVIYEAAKDKKECYVEYFDMDKRGNPINAHPLTVREAQQLAKALNTSTEDSKAFLKPQGIISSNVLYINPSSNGFAMWYTKAAKRQLYFIQQLGIDSGIAYVPALLWVANKHKLHIYALSSNSRPTAATTLYHAPFFNVYANGNVCMGTVDVDIKKAASLEEFTAAWEGYFFNSYFSHLMQGHNPIKGNSVSLWKQLLTTGEPFPKEVLKKNGSTIKNLLR